MTDQTDQRPQWQREFPDYPADQMPAIPASWSDLSWHNDACPSFLITSTLGLWVDWADPDHSDFAESRKSGDLKRFMLVRMDDGQHVDDHQMIAQSDDFEEIMREAVADQFAAGLKASMGEGRFQTMRERNVEHRDGPICASHDFLDANLTMASAFEAVLGYEPMTLPPEQDGGDRRHCSDVETPESEAAMERDCAIWNASWSLAKARYLTAA